MDKHFKIVADVPVTDQLKKLTKQMLGTDEAIKNLKNSLVTFNREGDRTNATMKVMLDEFREATISFKKMRDPLDKNKRKWVALNAVIRDNAKARREAALEQQRAAGAAQRATTAEVAVTRGVSIPGAATTDERFRYKQSITALKEFVARTKLGAKEINAVWAHVRKGEFRVYTGDLAKLQSTMYGVTKATQNLGASSRKTLERMSKDTKKVHTGTKNILLTWQSVIRIFAAQLIRRALTAIIFQLREATEAAIQFEIAISEIRTISQEAQLPFNTWSKSLRELSDSWGFDVLDQAEAAYQTLSNQVAKGADTFKFLAEANKFARVAATDTSTSVNLLTAGINAFGKEAEDADKVAAIFFKTIELGRVRAEEMSGSFGDVGILARQLNVDMVELGATISTLTIQGIKYNKAATQLRGVFVKLLKPTKDMKAFLEDIGVASGEAAIQTYGLGGFLKLLQERTRGQSSELAKYISRIRGLSGALALTGEGYETYLKNLDKVSKGEQSYLKAQEIAVESAGFVVQKEINKIKNFFTEELGRDILKTLADITKGIGGIVGALRILFYYSGVLTTTVSILNDYAKAYQRNFEEIKKTEKAKADAIAKQEKKITDGMLEELKKREQFISRNVAELTKYYNAAIKESAGIIGETNKQIKETFKATTKSINEQISSLKKVENDATRNIAKISEAYVDFQRAVQAKEFEIRLLDADKLDEKLKVITGRIKDIGKEIEVSLLLGDTDNVIKLLKERFKLEHDTTKLARDTDKENEKNLEKRKKIVKDLAELEVQQSYKIQALRIREVKARESANKASLRQVQLARAKALAEYSTKQKELTAQLSKAEIQNIDKYFTDYKSRYKKFLEEVAAIQERVSKEEQKRAEDAQKKRVELELALFDITQRVRQFREFDVREAAEARDPEKIQKGLADQQERLKAIIDLQKALGVDTINTSKLQLKLLEEQKIGEKEIQKIALERAAATRKQLLEDIKATAKKNAEERKAQRKSIAAQLAGIKAYAQEREFRIGKLGFAPIFGDRSREQIDFEAQAKQLFKDIAKFGGESTGSTLEFAKSVNTLRQRYIELGGTNQAYLRTLEIMQQQLTELLKKQQGLKKDDAFGSLKKVAKDYDDVLKNLRTTITGVSAAQAEALKKQKAEQEAQITLAQRYKKVLEDIIKLQRGGVKAVVPERFAIGGRVGRDTVPAMLSPGEFVMNSKATKRFYSQLLTMNAGSVQGYAAGGPVTNVGGVNISLNSSGNEQIDIIKIGKGLERAIRQRSIKL